MDENEQLKLEQAKLEINARLEEYKALRAEIVVTLTAAYQTTNLTLTGIGVLVAGSATIIKWNQPILFLTASFLFYAIAWTQLRYEQVVFNMSNHLINVVTPQIRNSIKDISIEVNPNFDSVLSWESKGRKHNHPSIKYSESNKEADNEKIVTTRKDLNLFAHFIKHYNPTDKWQILIEASRYIIPLFAGFMTSLAYVFVAVFSWTNILLFVASCLVLLFSIFATYRTRVLLQTNETSDKNVALAEIKPQTVIK